MSKEGIIELGDIANDNLSQTDVLRGLALLYVNGQYGTSTHDLNSRRRRPELTEARAMFVWLVRHFSPGTSYPTLGRWMSKDQSSIRYLHLKAIRLRVENRNFRRVSNQFIAGLQTIKESHNGSA